MEIVAIEKIIRSTIHIVMSNPKTLMPESIGSGCIIDYNGNELLLTVAHVTNKQAVTCIDTGHPLDKGRVPLYSVGAMNYYEAYDINKYNEQLEILKTKPNRIEAIDFGLVDFSFAILQHKVGCIQKEIIFKNIKISEGEKNIIATDLIDAPSSDKEYGFFGRIKPDFFPGTLNGNVLELSEAFYSGLKFIRKVKNYYEFKLPGMIRDNADFKGTSGAPIMDKDGNLVSLVTHGYEGADRIYGIALADLKTYVDTAIMAEKK